MEENTVAQHQRKYEYDHNQDHVHQTQNSPFTNLKTYVFQKADDFCI